MSEPLESPAEPFVWDSKTEQILVVVMELDGSWYNYECDAFPTIEECESHYLELKNDTKRIKEIRREIHEEQRKSRGFTALEEIEIVEAYLSFRTPDVDKSAVDCEAWYEFLVKYFLWKFIEMTDVHNDLLKMMDDLAIEGA